MCLCPFEGPGWAEAERVIGDLAQGTTQNYRTDWAHWMIFCLIRGSPPFPWSESVLALRWFEEELLAFAAYDAYAWFHPPALETPEIEAAPQEGDKAKAE